MVGHRETKRVIKGEKRYGCKKHRLKHAARHGAAYKHTVPYKRAMPATGIANAQ